MGRKLTRRERAGSTVAFALIAPVMFLMIFGGMEGGRMLFAWIVMTNEAREAARYGAVRYDPTKTASDQAAAVKQYLDQRLVGVLAQQPLGGVPNPRIVVTVNQTTVPAQVDVTISYRFKLGMLGSALPNPFLIRAHSVMHAE